MTQSHAAQALTEALLSIDPFSVTPEVGRPIEDLLVDMLREGQVTEVRSAVLLAQKAWGTLPEKADTRNDQRFIEHINPFLRFLREGDFEFLRSVKNEFFGFTGAGLTMDIPEKRYKKDTYFRYAYTLPISSAIAHFGASFPGFDCKTKTQLSHFCRLFAESTGWKENLYDFTKDLDFDYQNFHVWGSASELNHYRLNDNLAISSGFGVGFVSSQTSLLTENPDPRLIRRQEVFWKALNDREHGTGALSSIINLNLKSFTNGKTITPELGAKFFWQLMPRIADVLATNIPGLERNTAIKTLLVKGLEIHFGGQDFGFEASTSEWVDLKAILPLIKPKDREYVSKRLEGAEEKLNRYLTGYLEDDLGL